MTLAVAEALKSATIRLKRCGVEDPGGDAYRLLERATRDNDGGHRLALSPQVLSKGAVSVFEELVAAREARRPVAQILGRRHFFRHEFFVNSDVLDPRPETETLVRTALGLQWERLLDLGTGSGCILLSLLAEARHASGVGVDCSREALEVARKNAALLGVQDRCDFILSDWFSAVAGKFDLIVSNPPYVPAREYEALEPEITRWEPREALTEGGDGLQAYRTIAADAGNYLKECGKLILECGTGQKNEIATIFKKQGLCLVDTQYDLDGRERTVTFVHEVQ